MNIHNKISHYSNAPGNMPSTLWAQEIRFWVSVILEKPKYRWIDQGSELGQRYKKRSFSEPDDKITVGISALGPTIDGIGRILI